MPNRSCLAMLAAVLLCGAAPAQDVGFTTTWTKAGDVAGFEGSAGQLVHVAEGGNPGGFLKAIKTTTLYPKPYLRNNLGKLFGTGPGTISFDLKVLGDGSISGAGLFLSTGTQAFRYTATSKKLLGHDQTRADGWVRYTIPWKADWADGQAVAAGWQPYTGKTDHWSAVIDNPIWSHLEFALAPGKGAGEQAVGIDNFRVEAGSVLDAKLRKRIDPGPPQQKPVLHFAFDEGAGSILHDRSGNEAHGKISGATWVRNGGRWALEFDGAEDFVDCGEVSVLGPQTLTAWVYAEPIYSVWLGVSILGDASNSFTQHVHDVRAAGTSGLLPFRKWVHIAQAWDGKSARLYIDGTLVSVGTSREPAWRGKFLLAGPRSRAEGEPAEYIRRFKGKIASVLFYNRTLGPEEILEDLRTSNVTNSVVPMPIPQPGLGRIKVEVDAARLGKRLDNVRVTVDVLKAGEDGTILASATAGRFDALGRAVVEVAALALPRGSYVVRATASDAAGRTLGVPGEQPLAWGGSARFPSGPEGTRKLNNLVIELLRVPGPDMSGGARRFLNPRTGFVHVSSRGSKEVKLAAEGSAEGTVLSLSQEYGGAHETFRYLPKGTYTIATPVARDLAVRAVAQTVHDYANTQGMPVAPFGPYAGKFEERHVFPHMNTFLVQDADIDAPFAKALKAGGRRLLAHANAGFQAKPGQSPADATYDGLGKGLGFSHPRYDGYLVDEFAGSSPSHLVWCKALERLHREPRFRGRAVHAWTYALHDLVTYQGGAPGREFVRTLQRFDSPVQWECYLDSQQTELAAWRHIHDKIVGEALAAEQASPGIVSNLIVAPYAYVTAGPPWLTMTQPGYDTRTYLEMQVRTVATDPAFAGVRGLGLFRSTYADEETVRWAARLCRHYAIEGRTEPLGKDPYVLAHVRNGDFEEQGRHWHVQAAEEGSIGFALHHQLGSTQGRYTGNQGDTVLMSRRCGKAPNVFSQEIKDLKPGQLYSFRMFSADRRDLSKPERHAVRIEFDSADLVPEKCFTHVGAGRRPDSFLNWHVRVFRARGKTATLRISDWAGVRESGGAVGEELMYNFIKVQPYWEE